MSHNKCQTLPPWIWIWFILYAYLFPTLIVQWQEYCLTLFRYNEAPFSSIETHLLSLTRIPEFIPPILLFLGILTVIAPQLRKYHLERKYHLNENYTRILAIEEIEEFLKKYTPEIVIKANFSRFINENTFVYPLGYRKTAIAIPLKLIKSWRADRAGTEAILLHEIGHYRNGDALILGAGSFFEIVVKYSLTITLLYIVPTILVIIYGFIITLYDSLAIIFSPLAAGIPSSELFTYSIQWIGSQIISDIEFFLFTRLPEEIVTLSALFFNTLSIFVLPIVGIWCAELNADRFMLMSKRDDLQTSIRILEMLEDEKSLKSWLLSQISHPPKTLRRWLALNSCKEKSILVFLFLYPLGYIIQLLILQIRNLSSYMISYLTGIRNIQEIYDELFKNLVTEIHMQSSIWLFFAILFLLWPSIAVYWVKFFSGIQETYNWENYRWYFFSAVVFICTFVFCYTL